MKINFDQRVNLLLDSFEKTKSVAMSARDEVYDHILHYAVQTKNSTNMTLYSAIMNAIVEFCEDISDDISSRKDLNSYQIKECLWAFNDVINDISTHSKKIEQYYIIKNIAKDTDNPNQVVRMTDI